MGFAKQGQAQTVLASKERLAKATKPDAIQKATESLRRTSAELISGVRHRGHLPTIDTRMGRRPERMAFGGMIPMAASKWSSAADMTRILDAALAGQAALIHQQLQGLENGAQRSFTIPMTIGPAGVGLKLVQGHTGPVIARTAQFTRLQMSLIVTDQRNKEFMVITAYPDS